MTLDRLLPVAERCLKLGVPALALFPSIEPALKTPDGREATNPRGTHPEGGGGPEESSFRSSGS